MRRCRKATLKAATMKMALGRCSNENQPRSPEAAKPRSSIPTAVREFYFGKSAFLFWNGCFWVRLPAGAGFAWEDEDSHCSRGESWHDRDSRRQASYHHAWCD